MAFNELRKAGTAVAAESDDPNVWVAAAKGADGIAVMVVNFVNKEAPLSLDLQDRKVSWCRITDGARTWEACELPTVLPPYSFLTLRAPAE